jgi:hypothetical protein
MEGVILTEKTVPQDKPVQEKPVVVLRKVFKNGNSLCITLPPDWCRRCRVKAGSFLPLIGWPKDLTVLPPRE